MCLHGIHRLATGFVARRLHLVLAAVWQSWSEHGVPLATRQLRPFPKTCAEVHAGPRLWAELREKILHEESYILAAFILKNVPMAGAIGRFTFLGAIYGTPYLAPPPFFVL